MVEAGGEVLFPRPCFGDEDIVVTVVVAVRGRSPEADEIAAPDDCGNLPVNSSLRILDFRSSSSSQTVDGAVVETVDSVPSARALSGIGSCCIVIWFVNGDEYWFRGAEYERLDCR